MYESPARFQSWAFLSVREIFSFRAPETSPGGYFFFFLGDNAGVHRYHQSHQSRCRVGIGQDVCRRRRPFGVGVGLKGDTDTDDSSWVVGVGGGGGRPRFTRVHVRDRVSFFVFVVVFVVFFFVFFSAPVGGDRGCWSCGVLCCVEAGEADAWDGD